MADPIDPITANPDENNPSTIATEIDLFVTQIKAAIPQINTVITALNLNSTTSTSSTSMSIGTGTKSPTVETSKSYVIGMTVKIARTSDGTKWMLGEVTAYNSGTGALTVNVRLTNGSGGPWTDWTVSFAGPFVNHQNNEVVVHTGNGHGSTNNKVRRFTTTLVNTGSSITYADSATLGATFTINNDGVYAMEYIEGASSATQIGISKNSSQLTTGIRSINVSDRIVIQSPLALAAPSCSASAVLFLSAGDVIRPHTEGASLNDTSGHAKFSIRKVFEYV